MTLSPEDRNFVLSKVLVLEDFTAHLQPLDELASRISSHFQPVLLAFRRNLAAVHGSSSLPFHMVHNLVIQRVWTHMLIAERIRARNHDTDEATRDKIAIKNARQKMDATLAADAQNQADEVLEQLRSLLGDSTFSASCHEVLRQAVISLWATFEAYANDMIESYLNSHPEAAERLLTDEPTRKIFDLRADITLLTKHDFDLSKSMGTAILSRNGMLLDSLPTLKLVCAACFGGSAVLQILNQHEIWRLWQQRHLLLHRRGIVDEAYLSRSGDDRFPIGCEIVVDAGEVKRYFVLVRDAGLELARSCSNQSSRATTAPLSGN